MPYLFRLLRRLASSSAANSHPTKAKAEAKAKELLSLVKREREPSRLLGLLSGLPPSPPPRPLRRALSLAVASLSSSSPSYVRLLLCSLPPTPAYRRHAILFGEAGMLDDARQLFDEMPPTTRSLNALLSACIAAGKPEQAHGIIRDCLREHGVVPDCGTGQAVIRALCKSDRASLVFPILDELREQSVEMFPGFPTPLVEDLLSGLSIFLVDGLLKEVGRGGDVDAALEMLKQYGCMIGPPDENTMLQGLCKLGRSTKANQMLEKMKLDGDKLYAVNYHHLIQGFCREGELEQAKRLFEEMRTAGWVPNRECYLTMMHYLCKGGEFEQALEIYRLSVEKNWVPGFPTIRALVEGLVKGSRIEEAREIIQNMGERFQDKKELWLQLGDRLLGSS